RLLRQLLVLQTRPKGSRSGRSLRFPGRDPGGRRRDTGARGGNMNVKPLADRILVRRIEEPGMKPGGILIPDTAKEKPQEGEVVAVGPGHRNKEGKRIAMEIKKGEHILIGKYTGSDVKIDGTEYIILREGDVLGVLAKK